MSDLKVSASDPSALRALIDRLENYYDFECTGGPLRHCVEWQQLKAVLVPPAEATPRELREAFDAGWGAAIRQETDWRGDAPEPDEAFAEFLRSAEAPPPSGEEDHLRGWQPIETAPPEIGSRVLVWCPENVPDERKMLAERREHGWVIDIDGQTLHPTLWQPLPPDPAE
jgi:hypothetical protein